MGVSSVFTETVEKSLDVYSFDLGSYHLTKLLITFWYYPSTLPLGSEHGGFCPVVRRISTGHGLVVGLLPYIQCVGRVS